MGAINKIVWDGKEIEPVYRKKRGIILFRQVDNLLFISGHGPEDQITDEPLYKGRIGEDLTLEEGYAAARECGVIILGALKDILGSLDRVECFVKAFGLVNCAEGFHAVEHIMDGFTDVIMEALDERGYHARTTMGTRNLPNHNIPVEVEVIVKVKSINA